MDTAEMNSLDRLKNSKGEIWLNVASSAYVLEDFVNFDNHVFLRLLSMCGALRWALPAKYRGAIEEYRVAKEKAVLLRHDCRKPLPLPDNTANHILCSHFLEHVYPVEAEAILRSFHRKLNARGTLHVIVPDLKEQAERYLRGDGASVEQAADEFIRETLLARESKGTWRYRALECFGGFGLQHRWMYDRASMEKIVRLAGFSIIEANEANEIPSKGYRFNDGSVHVVARKSLDGD